MDIDKIEPKKVFYYFSEISKILRGSGNMKKITSYCINFAEKKGLKSYQDTYGNVMVFKNGTKGYERSEPVILQGHLDMVCEKRHNCIKDMDSEGIKLVTDGKWIWADSTTLGADDGIAAAYILALLDSDNIPHPPIEALLTVDEEIGLIGAKALDTEPLKGRRLINIDWEKEGVLTAGCAGATRLTGSVAVSFDEMNAVKTKKITVGGLAGGHSGLDINKRRKNAAQVIAELLYELNRKIGIYIADIYSGGKLNVIPSSSEAVICFYSNMIDEFNQVTEDFCMELQQDCADTESEVYVDFKDTITPDFAADKNSTAKIIFALMNIFNGIYAMNGVDSSLVQVSSNMGSVCIKNSMLEIGIMVRSNTEREKNFVIRKLRAFMEYIGGMICLNEDYPSWEYVRYSKLRETMSEVYREMYGELPKICTVHIGLECGILSEKLPNVDMVSFGPDIENVHTTDERISVSSIQRCWNYLLHVLEILK